MKRIRHWILSAGAALWMATLGVGSPAFGAYVLEFQSVTDGGASAASASFELVQQITLIGAKAEGQSASYTVTSVLDDSATPPSAIDDWMLFF